MVLLGFVSVGKLSVCKQCFGDKHSFCMHISLFYRMMRRKNNIRLKDDLLNYSGDQNY